MNRGSESSPLSPPVVAAPRPNAAIPLLLDPNLSTSVIAPCAVPNGTVTAPETAHILRILFILSESSLGAPIHPTSHLPPNADHARFPESVPEFHDRIHGIHRIRKAVPSPLPPIGSGAGDCAPAPSHTTVRAVFRIRRLDAATVYTGAARSDGIRNPWRLSTWLLSAFCTLGLRASRHAPRELCATFNRRPLNPS